MPVASILITEVVILTMSELRRSTTLCQHGPSGKNKELGRTGSKSVTNNINKELSRLGSKFVALKINKELG